MKNIINTVNSGAGRHQGKFTITSDSSTRKKKNTRSISCSHSDSFIGDFNNSLNKNQVDLNDNTAVYETTRDPARKIVHDCNSNNLSLHATKTTTSLAPKPQHTNLRRLKSWNKGFTRRLRELEENLPNSDEILETLREQVRNASLHHKRTKSEACSQWQGVGYNVREQWQGVGYNVRDQWQGIGFTVPIEEPATPNTSRRQKLTSELRKISKDHIQAPLRKISTSAASISSRRASSSSSLNSPVEPPVEFIDFGACYSPEEMKSWGQVIEKLATTIRNTNTTAQRRYSDLSDTLNTSLKEPAKRYISRHSVRRNQTKSYDCVKHRTGNDNVDADLNSLNNSRNEHDNVHSSSIDVSLSRECLDEYINESVSFSSNIWYYGELDIDNSDSTEESDSIIQGTIIVRVDCYGDVMYSISYYHGDEMLIAAFPSEGDRYSLDFNDPAQPRFSSPKYLIAYLIEQNYLQRVTFSWLIENGSML